MNYLKERGVIETGRAPIGSTVAGLVDLPPPTWTKNYF